LPASSREFRQAKLPSGDVELLAEVVHNWLTIADCHHAHTRHDDQRVTPKYRGL
jgi:hypothetical protein